MDINDRKKHLELVSRTLSETTKLLRLQEKLVEVVRASGSDAGGAEDILTSHRTSAAVLEELAREEKESGHRQTPPRFLWRRCASAGSRLRLFPRRD
jgi:hypothetical protein